jgi:hypothetical protein
MDRPDVPTSLQDSLQFDRLFEKITGARILATASASHNTAAGNAVQVCGPVASCIQYLYVPLRREPKEAQRPAHATTSRPRRIAPHANQNNDDDSMLHPRKMDVHLNVNLDSRGLLGSHQLSYNSSTMSASFGQPKRGEVLKVGQHERQAPACYLVRLLSSTVSSCRHHARQSSR